MAGISPAMVTELITPSGLLLRRHAISNGYDDNCLARLVRQGVLARIRQGAYARQPMWKELDERGKHQLLCEAVMTQYDDHVALSHDSAVIMHNGPDYGLDLSSVHLTHFIGTGRRSAGVIHHVGRCGVLDVSRLDEGWITAPTRTVLDVAREHGLEVGVVVADDFIRRGLTTPAELEQGAEYMTEWPGALILRLVVRLARGKSESVGESLSMLFFRRHGIPAPVQQHEVYYPDGRLAGRSDFWWPEQRVLGEFDGKAKYLHLRRPDESIADCVMREKAREDRMRELSGCRFIRLIWADLHRGEITARRLRAMLARAA